MSHRAITFRVVTETVPTEAGPLVVKSLLATVTIGGRNYAEFASIDLDVVDGPADVTDERRRALELLLETKLRARVREELQPLGGLANALERPFPPGAVLRRWLDDGRILTVYPEIFGTASLLIDDNPAMHETDRAWLNPADTESDGGADAYYQFDDVAAAIAAAAAMGIGDREPAGWSRAKVGNEPIRRRVRPQS